VISFKPKKDKEGNMKHTWYPIYRITLTGEKINNIKRFSQISDNIKTTHNCDFVIIKNIKIIKRELFKKAPKINNLSLGMKYRN
jgi:hypothetical protein